MKDSKQKMLADHMGHIINNHTGVYGMQSSILERAKIASLLIAMENGHINQFQGRIEMRVSFIYFITFICSSPEPKTHVSL